MINILFFLKTVLYFPVRIFTKISPLSLVRDSTIDKTSAVLSNCRIYDSKIGKYTYIGRSSIICDTTIGNFCSISSNCIIGPGNHPIGFVASSPVFYKHSNILKKCFQESDFEEYNPIQIGNDVWIGTHVFIKGGLTIGDGAIIGAYAVVTKDVEPYMIVGGNPAKLIKKRFDEAVIERIMKTHWWNWDDEKLQKNAMYFSSVDDFLKKVE